MIHMRPGLLIVRILFAGWLLFEFLNWINVLHFELDFSWLGLLLTAGFVWFGMEIVSFQLEKRTGQGLSSPVFFLGLVGISWDAIGDVSRFYSKFGWYDNAAHVIGGALATLVIFSIFDRLNKAKIIQLESTLLDFVSLAIASFLGLLYEIEEFLEEIWFGHDRLGDAYDTVMDLLLNIVGGLIILAVLFFFRKKSKS